MLVAEAVRGLKRSYVESFQPPTTTRAYRRGTPASILGNSDLVCFCGWLKGFPMAEYERQKAAWIAAHPNATHQQYTQAMRAIAKRLGI